VVRAIFPTEVFGAGIYSSVILWVDGIHERCKNSLLTRNEGLRSGKRSAEVLFLPFMAQKPPFRALSSKL
jgi:hypothetical protein